MNRRVSLSKIAVLVGALACATSTETKTSFAVAITPTVTATGQSILLNGQTMHRCSFPVTVQVMGGDVHEDVSWLGGQINSRLNSTGQTATLYILVSDETLWFGSDKLKPGQTISANVVHTLAGPFTGTIEWDFRLNYTNGTSDTRAATTQITCQ